MDIKMTSEELHRFLLDVFPQIGSRIRATKLFSGGIHTVMLIDEENLRPGGTVSGPAMFTLADCTFYMAILAHIGPEALTVTTSCSIDFFRKPPADDLRAEGRLLKLGRTLAVGDVMIFGAEDDRPVAHANLTYSIPRARS
ncbi:PaaI family thioesterase [Algicella marina]|uniref:Hotdog fold thioesterase n=1 Tax=Algicella marina TaxID=2683284 RepID=A0A6P1SZS0_9RHOB|nr:PaaI family thioesterase [Algicella marina]QHQ34863.1 hotdog fold thioesterase [Algicella marina]